MKPETKILKLARQRGILRNSDLKDAGIPRSYLYKLSDQGILNRVNRGLYTLKDGPSTEHISLIEMAKQVPKAVVSLLSALSFHGITTQLPFRVWIALPKGSWIPKLKYPPLVTVVVSPEPFSYGIETHTICGVTVKVYSLEKTIADCFKFRSKVGLDVAIEALRKGLHTGRTTPADIFKAAKVNRVSNVISPYIEAIV